MAIAQTTSADPNRIRAASPPVMSHAMLIESAEPFDVWFAERGEIYELEVLPTYELLLAAVLDGGLTLPSFPSGSGSRRSALS
jgi:hypothetical protein